jgi:hypothetical protein
MGNTFAPTILFVKTGFYVGTGAAATLSRSRAGERHD